MILGACDLVMATFTLSLPAMALNTPIMLVTITWQKIVEKATK